MKRDKWIQFLLFALLAAVGSILVGLLFFNRLIFVTERVGFQFLSLGIIGGVLFSSFRFLKKWIALIVLVVLLVLDEGLLHSGNWDFIGRDPVSSISSSARVTGRRCEVLRRRKRPLQRVFSRPPFPEKFPPISLSVLSGADRRRTHPSRSALP